MLRYAKEGIGESIVDMIGSIGQITQERYQDRTMLANYGNIPYTLKTPKDIYRTAERVLTEVKGLGGREELYITGMVKAMELFAHVLDGEQILYRDAIRTMQQVEMKRIPEERIRALSDRIHESLGKMGYQGEVGVQISTWLKDTTIEAEQVTDFARRYLGKAKEDTIAGVCPLPAEDEIDSVNSIRDVFWSGYSEYIGGYKGKLTFNIDRPWSVPTFVNILCHEGYPGHQTFYCHWDHLYQQGKLPLEGAFYSTAGNPANAMFEGSPELGLHFLGWDDFEIDTPGISDEEKQIFRVGRDVLDLQRMIQTSGCYLYHVEGCSAEEVVAYMLKPGFYTRVEAENSCRFFSHPVQRYYYPAYYYGRWMIAYAYDSVPKDKRGEFFRLLYDRPHTNETLIREVSELTGKGFDPFARIEQAEA